MNGNATPRFDLSVVVVNYNGRAWLEGLLPDLERYVKQSRFQVEVIVVDNASTDDSLAWLETQTGLRLIRSNVNGGFAFGNNLAIKTINSRYICLLNSDTNVPDSLDLLVEYLDTEPTVGVVTPRIITTSGSLDKACHRGEPTPWASLTYLAGLERLFPRSRWLGRYHQGWSDLSTIHSVDACTGAAMMVRKAAIEQVGLLDERFFMYGEDLDWCRRFREAGFSLIYHPGVTVVHHKYKSGLNGASAGTRQTTKAWVYKAMLLYYDKYNGGKRGLFRATLWLYVKLKG